MDNQLNYYNSKMNEILSLKQRVNPHYSLRAFARDLDIHPGTLTKVISGERGLPVKNAKVVINKLKHTPKERTLLLESLFRRKAKLDDISFRLNIPLSREEVVVENLLVNGILAKDEEGKVVNVQGTIKTTEDIKSQALKESHMETLKMGIKKLKEIEVELREFSSIAAAIDLDQLTDAKLIIREFRQKKAKLPSEGINKKDVYQLAIQFYPVTNLTKH